MSHSQEVLTFYRSVLLKACVHNFVANSIDLDAAAACMAEREAKLRTISAIAKQVVRDYEAWAPGFVTPRSMVNLRAALAAAQGGTDG